jgi:hypothetical protein
LVALKIKKEKVNSGIKENAREFLFDKSRWCNAREHASLLQSSRIKRKLEVAFAVGDGETGFPNYSFRFFCCFLIHFSFRFVPLPNTKTHTNLT